MLLAELSHCHLLLSLKSQLCVMHIHRKRMVRCCLVACQCECRVSVQSQNQVDLRIQVHCLKVMKGGNVSAKLDQSRFEHTICRLISGCYTPCYAISDQQICIFKYIQHIDYVAIVALKKQKKCKKKKSICDAIYSSTNFHFENRTANKKTSSVERFFIIQTTEQKASFSLLSCEDTSGFAISSLQEDTI